MLEFGEGLLDGVQVGRVFRQEDKMRARVADGRAHGLAFVTAEIVHDHDVARTKRGDENRFDVEKKAFAVDGTIDEPRRIDAVVPERRQKRHRVLVAVGRPGFQAFSAGTPAAQGRHVCPGPGLIDEDQPVWINAVLIPCPLAAPSSNVGTILLFGQKCFF